MRQAILYLGFNFEDFGEGFNWAKIHLQEKLIEQEWDYENFPLIYLKKHSDTRFYTLLLKHKKHLEELGTTMIVNLNSPPSYAYAEED